MSFPRSCATTLLLESTALPQGQAMSRLIPVTNASQWIASRMFVKANDWLPTKANRPGSRSWQECLQNASIGTQRSAKRYGQGRQHSSSPAAENLEDAERNKSASCKDYGNPGTAAL